MKEAHDAARGLAVNMAAIKGCAHVCATGVALVHARSHVHEHVLAHLQGCLFSLEGACDSAHPLQHASNTCSALSIFASCHQLEIDGYAGWHSSCT